MVASAAGCAGKGAGAAAPGNAVASIEYPAMAAHRGGLALYPESTMVAFESIVRNYPHAVLEMDVRTLRDGRLVVFHDSSVGRVATNSKARVSDLDSQQWRALRIADPQGGPAQPPVFLDEVLQRFGGTERVLMIERKGATDLRTFMDVLRPFRSQVILQDFERSKAESMTAAGFKVVQLTGKGTPKIIPGVYALGVASDAITNELCERAHEQDTVVWAWGDDVVFKDPQLLSLGVDGFIVNDPSRSILIQLPDERAKPQLQTAAKR